ncbi:Uncharacterised protein [Shigella sonnei]|nr:Uncharacterised protein [Shigella sonnei]
MRRKRLIRLTAPVPIVGLIRRVKRRIRHGAPIAGCSHHYSEIQVPASPASVSSIRDNAPIHAGLPRLLT